MSKPVSIVLAGIGGMGSVYVQALLVNEARESCGLVGAVDPAPERCPRLDELRGRGVAIYQTLEEFYKQGQAELAVISSPIQFHADQTCLALEHGSHVLCEKPVAATIQEARRMLQAERRSGRWVAVGYQWSFSSAIQDLKRDILTDAYGAPRRLRCLYLWPRDFAYYGRNDWAGKRRDAAGRWILDSPAMNAMGHDLHNMFYVLGPSRDTSAAPVEVEAELYRAYPIENFDTGAIRARLAGGVEVLFLVSHASRDDRGPVFSYEFEKGEVTCSSRTSGIKGRLAGGEVRDYGVPDAEPMNKLWQAIRAVRGGPRPACGIEAALSQTLCLNGVQMSQPEPVVFPAALVHRTGEGGSERLWVEGLDEAMIAAYEAGRLPSETGASWGVKGRPIQLSDETTFTLPEP
ncbi:MAG: Gfo/Idh/MocA family oxidoreductase [Candidatus Aminicenantes bacterium]|nr:Gfo/Idh/MocA family oxidoreductase [Candidatus Aminicenantes bacterium]